MIDDKQKIIRRATKGERMKNTPRVVKEFRNPGFICGACSAMPPLQEGA